MARRYITNDTSPEEARAEAYIRNNYNFNLDDNNVDDIVYRNSNFDEDAFLISTPIIQNNLNDG